MDGSEEVAMRFCRNQRSPTQDDPWIGLVKARPVIQIAGVP